jgi:CRP/FNR family cyclic AMP-dependent transcriptional regulator
MKETRQNLRSNALKTLHNCSLFYGVPTQDLDDIAQAIEITSAPRGRLIMQHGDQTTEMYFLLSGGVIGQLVAGTGREVLFTEIAVGGYFGEFAALDSEARSITISASADCVFAKLSGAKFRGALLAYPQLAVNLATDLARRLRGMNDRVFGLVVYDVETRVRIRLMQLAQAQEQLIEGGIITDMPTHEAMASFVGANREAVSRAISHFSKAGIIATQRKKVVIKDLGGLLFYS